MIKFTFKGYDIAIRNDDWKKLKKRFNPDNAKCNADGNFAIDIICSLCERYRKNTVYCTKCPLDKIAYVEIFGCGEIMASIWRREYLEVSQDYIWWDKRNNKQARRQLRALLRRMEKIEQNQEKGNATNKASHRIS